MNANLLAVNFDGSVNLLQTALVVCVFWALLRGKNAIPNKRLFHLGWIAVYNPLVMFSIALDHSQARHQPSTCVAT